MKKIVEYFKRTITYICILLKLAIQKLIMFIKLLINTKFNLLKLINKLSNIQICAFYVIIFIIGRILLLFNPIPFDLIHQIVLTVISFIILYSLKYVYNMTEEIKKASSGVVYNNKINNCTAKTLKTFVDQMIKMQQSVWLPIIMLFPPIEFIRKNIYLEFIEKNPAGYYAIVFAAITYYLALLGYVQILIALIQFYKISHDMGGCIPLDFPHDTITPPKWFLLWNELFEKIIHSFFVVGTLFTLEYVLLMPKDIVKIDASKHIVFNVRDVTSFLISWGIIFLFIIVAFPLIAYAINLMKKLLIKNFGKKINHEYEVLLGNNISAYSPLDIWAYKQLIDSTSKYHDYFRASHSIIPIASTLMSFLLNAIKLFESVLLP